MKRSELERRLRRLGCRLLRHGSRHDVWVNDATGEQAPVPRHRELTNAMARVIWEELGLDPAEF